MAKLIAAGLLAALAGCSAVPRARDNTESPCAVSEASYACQVERYHNVSVE